MNWIDELWEMIFLEDEDIYWTGGSYLREIFLLIGHSVPFITQLYTRLSSLLVNARLRYQSHLLCRRLGVILVNENRTD